MIDSSSRSLARGSLALLILSPVLLTTVVIVTVSMIALSGIGPVPEITTDAGLARLGDGLALVVVTGGGADTVALRELIARWGLAAPALFLIAGSFVAWWLSGKVQRRIDRAEQSISTADEERESRLQEVVHELRTPLAVMGTNLELAGTGGSSPRYLDAARRAVARMSRTVADLAGHGQLAVESDDDEVDFASVSRAFAEEYEGPGRERGVVFRVVADVPVHVNRVDPAAIRAAVGNFMSNAMRVAPRGSSITLDCGETGEWAWLAVTDAGPGLAPHHHARVFERGWQGSHFRARRDGSGLGLTIARQLTEAQGGLVTVESEEGGGATFALWLPLTHDADPASVVASDGIHPVHRPWMRQPDEIGLVGV